MSQPKSHPSWIGHTISGRYQIESLLGQGGMSSVYKATDPNLRRTVAVKLIHPHLSSDEQFVRRFEQEAAAVAQLRHPNIIQVFDFNHDGDVYYMVLEFIPGETLQDQLTKLTESGHQFELAQTTDIMATTCDAVAYAHDKGMIHRDLKPANVMLNPNGQPILMDFGVAKMLGTAQHTATGAIIGTAKYMSPEQARGERPDARTDIYSLGVMLFEMITGAAPFDGESTVAILMKHVTEELPDINQIKADVPPGLAAVVKRALDKDRDERYQSAAEMAAALRAVNLDEKSVPVAVPIPHPDPDETILQTPGAHTSVVPPALPTPSPAPAPAPTGSVAVPMWAIGAVIVLLVLILAGGAYALFNRGESDSNEAEQHATETAIAAAALPADTPTPVPPTPIPTEPPTEEPAPQPTSTPEPPPTATPVPEQPTETPVSGGGDTLPTATTVPEQPTDTPTPEPPPTEPPPPPTKPPQPVAPPGMVAVPPGSFVMGSDSGEPNERPPHPVSLDAYFIDKLEVTNAEYRRCVAAGNCTPAQSADSFTHPGYRDDPAFDDFPVISVNWDQARDFCRSVDKRLPTEAEWEFAARGPENRTWPWGNQFDPNLSAANSDDVQKVGSFPRGASSFGVLDMAGNAGEWVVDTFDPNFYANAPERNPVNTAPGGERVFRGGSFANPDGKFYTTSRRYTAAPDFVEVDIGFRCAKSGSRE